MAIANLHNVQNVCHNIDSPQWSLLKTGDAAALGYFYDRYVDSLFSFALRLTKNRDMAEDAIQEVFVELWQYREGIGEVSHSLAYLQKALRNKLLRMLRTALRKTELPLTESLFSSDSNREETLIRVDEEKETRSRLTRAYSLLSQRQQLLLTLHFYEGLSYEQIAERLRMNYQSVNNLAYRTMLRLRDHMLLLVLAGLLFA